MSKPVTFAICGCGCRGLEAYAPYQKQHPDNMKITAGADPDEERLRMLREGYGVSEENCFLSDDELLEQPRLADVMIIATQDRQHVRAAIKALEKGYHLLLEKPISPDLEECKKLLDKAHETGRVVLVCHVLRYTRFYAALHEILSSGKIGKIETIDAVEHVAYWHHAHSFVRGNWRRTEESSPMILAKCCHDMDILRWLAGKKCLKVTSFGSLDYFRSECAPEGSTLRCLDCGACKEGCPYDAEKIYLTNEASGLEATKAGWPCSVLTNYPTESSIYEALRRGPYGRCVFHCDNDVVDHQTLNLEFEDHITAVFTMTAFTRECRRTIKVTGTLGEVEGDMEENKLYLRPFGAPVQVKELGAQGSEFAGHGGGDMGMMEYICNLIAGGSKAALTDVDASVESHVMALAAEHSRLNGGCCVDVRKFINLSQT